MAHDPSFAGETSAALVRRALSEQDDDTRWSIVTELHRRGGRTELDLAQKLLEGSEDEQVLACDVLGQLGRGARKLHVPPFGLEAAQLIGRTLQSPSPAVQQAAVTAAAHLRWETLVEPVIALSHSQDASVRHAVAFALGGRTDDASIDTLVALSEDDDEDVRNWATFGLGTQCPRRDARVCDALAARIDDPHEETRGEAWAGLAAKGDPRAFETVLHSLESDDLWKLAIEAAESYRHPAFLPALERWLTQCDDEADGFLRSLLEDAIRACRAGALDIA